MLHKIYDILVSLFGESKQGYYDKSVTQYQFNSPWATEERGGIPDNKYNLEVSLSLGKYHEWTTDFAGNISKLIKYWGGKELLEEYYSIVKELKESKFFQLNLFQDDGSNGYTSDYIRLPETFTKIDLNTCRDKRLVEYLKKRHIEQDLIDYYNIGYTTWNEPKWSLRNRIIIPSYDINGDLNYWIGRDYVNKKGSHKTKYLNCDADKNAIVLHEDKIRWDADIVLVEGVLDCIYYSNTIALMGKFLKNTGELFYQLYEKSNARIIICLDSDTTIEETKRIYKVLNVGRLKGRIWYIELNENMGKDFGEIYEKNGKNGIINAMRTSKQFSEIELLF